MSSKATKFKNMRKDILSFIEINNISTVSFDVFDTLLHRRCEPDAVIDGVTLWLNNHIKKKYRLMDMDSLAVRHLAYGQLIAQKEKIGLDLDTTIEEMSPVWVESMLPELSQDEKDNLATLIMEKELEFELSACYANIFSLEFIKEMKRKGLKIIYVSDMYLGKSIVDKLLYQNGYEDLFDAGYVSGDISLLKRTGRLFGYVIEDLVLTPEETLHIGDNYEADYIMAKKCNLRAFFIGDHALDYKKNTNKFDYLMSKKDPSWKGYAIASFARSTPYELGSEIESYGKRNFGPLFSSFVHNVIERCVEENIDKIYFLSREGFLLGMIYDELLGLVDNNEKIQSAHYLYVSRLTTFLAALNEGIGLREIRSISDNVGGAISVSKLLSPFKFDQDTLAKIAAKHGLNDINEILPHFYLFWTPFINFINDNELKELVKSKHKEAKELLIKLLKQEGFFDAKKVAIVDVGWGGQIQENIYQAIKNEKNKPIIIGMYMSTNINAHTRKTPDNWTEWMVSDEAHLDWNGYATFEFVQSFEAIARAPHATVVGYEQKSSMIVPKLKNENDLSRQAEIEDDRKVLSIMQKGIMEYAIYYRQASMIYNAAASDTLAYAKLKMSTAIRFPDKVDAKYLLSLRNSSDLGLNDIFALGSSKKTKKYSLKTMKYFLQHSFWKNGTASQMWGFPMQIALLVSGYKKRIPNKFQSLAPGIVWNTAINSAVNREKRESDNKIRIDGKYVQLWKQNIEYAKKESKIILKNKHEEPIKTRELLYSQIAFYMVNFFMSLTRKHTFYYGGISKKKILLRSLAGHLSHNKIFVSLYKKLNK